MFDPMKQILSIYEASRNTYTIAHLDDFEVPQCDVPSHGTDPKDRGHSGPAAFFLITPCHHHEGYLCAPIAGWLKANGDLDCRMCGQRLYGPELTFTPIGIS